MIPRAISTEDPYRLLLRIFFGHVPVPVFAMTVHLKKSATCENSLIESIAIKY